MLAKLVATTCVNLVSLSVRLNVNHVRLSVNHTSLDVRLASLVSLASNCILGLNT